MNWLYSCSTIIQVFDWFTGTQLLYSHQTVIQLYDCFTGNRLFLKKQSTTVFLQFWNSQNKLFTVATVFKKTVGDCFSTVFRLFSNSFFCLFFEKKQFFGCKKVANGTGTVCSVTRCFSWTVFSLTVISIHCIYFDCFQYLNYLKKSQLCYKI